MLFRSLIVDSVEEVINLAESDIEPTPNFGGQIAAQYIAGIATVKGTVKSLLNIDAVVGHKSGAVSPMF